MRVLLSVIIAFALSACTSLTDRAAGMLATPELKGTRWGLVVMTMDGRELVSINPDARFLPASNTKIFTVAAVAFLPPTLIASIYGMNFEFMPELHWQHGYLVAIGLMVLSAVLPFWYFRKRGWL